MPEATDPDVLIDTKAAARYLGIQPGTLSIWRATKRADQPQFLKIGPRAVRYSKQELRRWAEDRRRSALREKCRRVGRP